MNKLKAWYESKDKGMQQTIKIVGFIALIILLGTIATYCGVEPSVMPDD